MFRSIGISQKIFLLSMLGRFWHGISLLPSLFIISHYLSPEAIGDYYFLFTIYGILILGDLGFTVILSQRVAYILHKLSISPIDGFSADKSTQAYLFDTFNHARNTLWKVVLPFSVFIAIGSSLLSVNDNGFGAMQLACYCVCLFSFGDIILNFAASYYDGLKRFVTSISAKLIKSVFFNIIVWILVSLGLHLYAIPVAMLSSSIIGFLIILIIDPKPLLFLKEVIKGKYELKRNSEINLQVKLAFSFIGAFATYNLFVPILYKIKGAEVAGQFGLTWHLAEGATTISLAIINMFFQQFNNLASQKLWSEHREFFFTTLIFVLGISTLVFTSSLTGYYLLMYFNVAKITDALLPWVPLTLLFATTVIKSLISLHVVYLRSFKEEPTLLINAISLFIFLPVVTITAIKNDIITIILIYFVLLICVHAPYNFYLEKKYRAYHEN